MGWFYIPFVLDRPNLYLWPMVFIPSTHCYSSVSLFWTMNECMWNWVYWEDSRHSISSWELAWTLNSRIRGLFHIYPWILETHLSQQFLSHYLACKLLGGKVCILRHQFSLNWLWTEKVRTWCLIGMIIKYAAQARHPAAGMVKGTWPRAGNAWPEPWRVNRSWPGQNTSDRAAAY